MNDVAALLQVEGLVKHYPIGSRRSGAMLHAVDRVDLSIAAGECVGLVGESGCGKSTLARLIARLIESTDGRIIFKGQDLTAISAPNFSSSPHRAEIQVVFQDPTESLNPTFRVFDSIADPLRRLLKIKNRPEIDEKVLKVAELVALPKELLQRYPHQLSGGQRARVGIARAIVVEPSLLVLDEPTSALDVSVQAVILKLLAELHRRSGMSYLFVSHDLNVVRLLCDRIVVMYLGRVVEIASAATLFSAARHPYTRALLDSIPDPARRDEPRLRLDGSPTSPINPDPNTCRFYGRCPIGTEACTESSPSLRVIEQEHMVACHFA